MNKVALIVMWLLTLIGCGAMGMFVVDTHNIVLQVIFVFVGILVMVVAIAETIEMLDRAYIAPKNCLACKYFKLPKGEESGECTHKLISWVDQDRYNINELKKNKSFFCSRWRMKT